MSDWNLSYHSVIFFRWRHIPRLLCQFYLPSCSDNSCQVCGSPHIWAGMRSYYWLCLIRSTQQAGLVLRGFSVGIFMLTWQLHWPSHCIDGPARQPSCCDLGGPVTVTLDSSGLPRFHAADWLHSFCICYQYMDGTEKDYLIAALADFLCFCCYCHLYWNLKVFLRYKLPDQSCSPGGANSTKTGDSRRALTHIFSYCKKTSQFKMTLKDDTVYITQLEQQNPNYLPYPWTQPTYHLKQHPDPIGRFP